MKATRVAVVLLFSFMIGGSSAELAVQTKRALARQTADREQPAQAEGAAGELVALQIQRDDGAVVARPRLIASPGRPAQLLLRDPEHPDRVRLALRVETSRQASGLRVEYLLTIPAEELVCRGSVLMTPGVERRLDLGRRPLSATLVAMPVPSAAFEAFLRSERTARRSVEPI